ncbi:MAG TPA: hypothetical protein VHD69_01425 [Candidatus Paceibacterota bacterium]|jgi:hypothetical protein|nr:hypothetical protein [Candidatus Paceibacterota bacterium]
MADVIRPFEPEIPEDLHDALLGKGDIAEIGGKEISEKNPVRIVSAYLKRERELLLPG